MLVFEGVHARPIAVVLVRGQLVLLDQSLEGFMDQFLAVANVIENLLLEDEESAVDGALRRIGRWRLLCRLVLTLLVIWSKTVAWGMSV